MSNSVGPWTIANQAPLPMEFYRQEYWNGVPFPTLRDPPNPVIEHTSLGSLGLAGGFFINNTTWNNVIACIVSIKEFKLLYSLVVFLFNAGAGTCVC